ncbi:heavy-metal-associated domain-containing protein [Sphingomonas quercus]|uniref:Heavy-metal-associated domain-containing protein n=1 Tax=Sphingomonas quercus TaxID=2842451 RepID=A0ABS6BGM2_9SPHN|nr:heavy-metal-associated domain-containing protein [Sphingomonas quercus]MBU3077446.1 heavy-metal-associated domain-containing protein [Sphingomonas quercus]
MTFALRLHGPRPVWIAAACVAALAGLAAVTTVTAQIEEGERGVAPVDSTSNYEVLGIAVDAGGRNADAARMAGWREAQRRGWKMLWAKLHDGAAGPTLPDATLDSIVAGILVEEEQIGVHRYVAKLGVQFDRARAGRLLGVGGNFTRSAPMLVIPVMWSGGTFQTFESRTEWQKAWARFRSGASAIDYVRPVGTGVDPLLLNVAQSRRPGRRWWRMLIDLYGAADVVVPEVALQRQWPGGPVIARFTARHGADATLLGGFTLTAPNIRALPATLDEGVRRIDAIYTDALNAGRLNPDKSLAIRETAPPDVVPGGEGGGEGDPLAEVVATPSAAAQSFTVQVETPDAASVGAIEAAIRAAPGVSSAGVTSLAVGGISLVHIGFAGDQGALAAALAAHGLRLEDAGGVLRIRRGAPPAAPAPAAPPPAPAAAAPAPTAPTPQPR